MIISDGKTLNPKVIEITPITDERGYFAREFCANELKEAGIYFEIKQVNHSFTKNKGVVRGLHFQFPPFCESKIVRCIKGSIFDVAVDLRKNSPSFLQYSSQILTDKNMKAFYIPKGFAHGFQTLEDDCELLYFHDEFYNRAHEGALNSFDSKINIKWPLEATFLSARDKTHELIDNKILKRLEVFYI